MKKIIIFVSAVVFLASLVWLLSFRKSTPKIKIGDASLNIEIAETEAERAQGLSDRKSLCEDCGLLFIFDSPGIYPFWMRRMYFDIDILWIRNGEVVDITYGAKVPPKEELEAPKTFYQSKVPVDMVLEVNAGWTEKNKVKMGEKVVTIQKLLGTSF